MVVCLQGGWGCSLVFACTETLASGDGARSGSGAAGRLNAAGRIGGSCCAFLRPQFLALAACLLYRLSFFTRSLRRHCNVSSGIPLMLQRFKSALFFSHQVHSFLVQVVGQCYNFQTRHVADFGFHCGAREECV